MSFDDTALNKAAKILAHDDLPYIILQIATQNNKQIETLGNFTQWEHGMDGMIVSPTNQHSKETRQRV